MFISQERQMSSETAAQPFSQKIIVPVDPSTREWLTQTARREDRSLSAVVRRALREAQAREIEAAAARQPANTEMPVGA